VKSKESALGESALLDSAESETARQANDKEMESWQKLGNELRRRTSHNDDPHSQTGRDRSLVFSLAFWFQQPSAVSIGNASVVPGIETDRDCTKKSLTPPACISSHTHLRTLYVS